MSTDENFLIFVSLDWGGRVYLRDKYWIYTPYKDGWMRVFYPSLSSNEVRDQGLSFKLPPDDMFLQISLVDLYKAKLTGSFEFLDKNRYEPKR